MSGTCIWYFEVASPSLILELPPAGNASADFSLKDTSTAAILIVAGLLSGNLRMSISLLLSDSTPNAGRRRHAARRKGLWLWRSCRLFSGGYPLETKRRKQSLQFSGSGIRVGVRERVSSGEWKLEMLIQQFSACRSSTESRERAASFGGLINRLRPAGRNLASESIKHQTGSLKLAPLLTLL